MAIRDENWARPTEGPNFKAQEELLTPCCRNFAPRIGFWVEDSTFYFTAYCPCGRSTEPFTCPTRAVVSWNQEVNRLEQLIQQGVLPPEYFY
jgi:hypothetical protein